MEFASPLLELVKGLWGLASKPLGYIINLKENVRSLGEAKQDLNALSEDVKARVEREEGGGGAKCKEQVKNWLDKVREFEVGVDQALQEAGERDQIKCLDRFLPRNCWSSYELGKRVDQLLNQARELQNEKGRFSDVTSPLPRPGVLVMPMDKTVGLDSSLNKVWKWLVDKKVGVIGLYGTGGVGKTSLMKRINEKLSPPNHGFEIVIWVVVSRQVNEGSIQDTIRKRLDIKDDRWNTLSWEERVHCLCDNLTKKKYVLLIDDLWEFLDLSKIGVPRPARENGSKIVLTTRSKQVCDQMKVDQTFEVQCLMLEEALELFEDKAGKSTLHSHPDIPELAKDIVRECKGLPLALTTVGRAMAGKKNPHEWKHALTTLRNNPHKLRGKMEEMYHILEFSYHGLNDSTIQRCFLYCCLFPEDYPIRPHNLIELWIGKGLLGDTDDLYSMRDKGESILEDLKRACLLESGGDDINESQYVKMHDVIRDMATWIARDHGQRENKLLVIENEKGMSAEMISKWGEAEQVSLWGKLIQNINQTPPQCSQLETLLVRDTNVSLMPGGFFSSMKACLTFLDLSGNRNIELFPEGICDLIKLRYLNLSATSIQELPKEIKNLTLLQWLLLDDTTQGILIPTGAIKSLPLNVFSQWCPSPLLYQCFLVNEEDIIEELRCMQYLTDLSISVSKSSSVLKIFQSSNIRKYIRRAFIHDSQNDLASILISYSPASSGDFSHLEVLCLMACEVLRKMEITPGIGREPASSCFPNLGEVDVRACGLLNLSWLVHAPTLRKLTVMGCNSMEKIIGDGFTREELAALKLFSRLEDLFFWGLPKLTSICDHALSFPDGASFRIIGCPGLKKLPLDSSDARGSFKLQVFEEVWWAEFEWDPADRVTFQLPYGSDAEEIAFGEAISKIKDEAIKSATIGFGPSGSGPTNQG